MPPDRELQIADCRLQNAAAPEHPEDEVPALPDQGSSRSTICALQSAIRNPRNWAVLVWVIVVVVVCTRSALQPQVRNLVPTWRAAGEAWLHGGDLYPVDGRPGQELFRYGPPVTPLFVPLALLPEGLGNVLWRLLNAGAFLAAMAWWLRSAAPHPDGSGLTAQARGLLYLFLVPLSLGSLNNGQPNLLLAALLLAGLAALAEDRWNLAAGSIAAATVLKLYPAALGLLLVVVHPRRFGPRYLLALILLLASPFLLQSPDYVLRQYGEWWTSRLASGDEARRYWPVHATYRDLWLLFRVAGIPITLPVYHLIQFGSAAACALFCLVLRCRMVRPTGSADPVERFQRRQLLQVVWLLAVTWMMLCGPATESSTYSVLAPVLAWALVGALTRLDFGAWWKRGSVVLAGLLLLVCVLAGLTPWSPQVHGWGLHPLAALFLLVGSLFSCQ
jgi:hypothetical protein